MFSRRANAKETSTLQCKIAIMSLLHGIYVHGLMTTLLGWTTLGACGIESMRIDFLKAVQWEYHLYALSNEGAVLFEKQTYIFQTSMLGRSDP